MCFKVVYFEKFGFEFNKLFFLLNSCCICLWGVGVLYIFLFDSLFIGLIWVLFEYLRVICK